MEHEHVVSGLLRKRAELAGELEALQARAGELIASLDGLDTAIRLFAPDAELDAVGPKRPAVLHAAMPGQTSRAVLEALRDAAQPFTTRELTLHAMAGRGLDADDHALFLTVQKRALASLRNLRMRGLVCSDRQAGHNLRWALA
ncbi:MAG: hypothetical protein JO326_14860 [Acetobacteraceae bacterium]|nr:hypothetical protein [Acetobacteraceae bacterium]